jgi:hypothetical protein
MHAQLVALHRDGSRAAYFRMNQQIHAEIARLAGNPVLHATWTALTAKILWARSLANFDARRWDESINEHESFMALLRAGNTQRFADASANTCAGPVPPCVPCFVHMVRYRQAPVGHEPAELALGVLQAGVSVRAYHLS